MYDTCMNNSHPFGGPKNSPDDGNGLLIFIQRNTIVIEF